MELLKEVARDRLVVMVTHNPELAERYATRIVKLKDGVIRSDTMPYEPEDEAAAVAPCTGTWGTPPCPCSPPFPSVSTICSPKRHAPAHRLCRFHRYHRHCADPFPFQRCEPLYQQHGKIHAGRYPLQISSTGVDLASMMEPDTYTSVSSGSSAPEGMVTVRQLLSQLNIGAASNDLRSLKAYLDSDACTIRDNATVEYTYTPDPLIYRQNPDGTVQKLNPDTTFSDIASENTSVTSLMTSMASPYVFCEMAETPALYEDQYDVKAGRWPEKYNELVLTLNADGSVSDYALYAMGLRDQPSWTRSYSSMRRTRRSICPRTTAPIPMTIFWA